MDDHRHFHRVIKGNGSITVVQGKNNMLFEDKCPKYPQDTLINLCVIHQTSKA